MSEKNLWFGYLEAGEKSSPVVMDSRLNTANPNTIYLFNLIRGEIIEYRRDIIEPKLRPLADGEGRDEKKLKSAYTKVRGDFIPRGGKINITPEKAVAKPVAKKTTPIESDDEDDDAMDSMIGEDMDVAWEED